jgi:mono/diheme cytochrome c family protein
MRRIFLYLVSASIFICLAVLALPARLRAQGDADKLYKTNCVLCHAADGSGNSPSGKALGAKDLGSAEIQKKTDEELTELITAGKGKMPAFGKKLKPDDIKQLVAYIRSLPKKK